VDDQFLFKPCTYKDTSRAVKAIGKIYVYRITKPHYKHNPENELANQNYKIYWERDDTNYNISQITQT
jgi:hypothetical protein